jgi:Polymer-forming cytoskeletal
MWSSKTQSEVPGYSPSPAQSNQPVPFSSPASSRQSSPSARNLACLGASIEVKGKISGEEDLQVDGKVEGPVALNGQRLTVGRTGQLSSEITAREVVVYGTLTGNLRARDRVEIKMVRWWAISGRRESASKMARTSRDASRSSAPSPRPKRTRKPPSRLPRKRTEAGGENLSPESQRFMIVGRKRLRPAQ